jgi:hypothetical protein
MGNICQFEEARIRRLVRFGNNTVWLHDAARIIQKRSKKLLREAEAMKNDDGVKRKQQVGAISDGRSALNRFRNKNKSTTPDLALHQISEVERAEGVTNTTPKK